MGLDNFCFPVVSAIDRSQLWHASPITPRVATRLKGCSRTHYLLYVAVHRNNSLVRWRVRLQVHDEFAAEVGWKMSWFLVRCSDLSSFHFQRKTNQPPLVTPFKVLPQHAMWRTWKEEHHFHFLRHIFLQIGKVVFLFFFFKYTISEFLLWNGKTRKVLRSGSGADKEAYI